MKIKTIRVIQWPYTKRPEQIKNCIYAIKEYLNIHGYNLKKLDGQEIWKIGKYNNVCFLAYNSKNEFILFPHSANVKSIIERAIENELRKTRLMS